MGGSSRGRNVRPQRGEGRLHNYNFWQYLGGEVGSVFGGKLSCLGGGGGGGGEASPAPPSLDETLTIQVLTAEPHGSFSNQVRVTVMQGAHDAVCNVPPHPIGRSV